MTRLAVAGYGWMAARHVEVFRALGAEVVAAANRSEEGRRRAGDGGLARTYASATEMVERERPDAVLVTASVLSQFALTRSLLPFGVPLLVEKPPGTSAAEAEELAGLAAAHRTPVMVALNRRFYSVLHGALARVGGREAVRSVDVEWSEDPAKMARAGHPAEVLPRLVFANSLHGLDLLTLLAGRLSRPSVRGESAGESPWPRWRMALEGIGPAGAKARFRSTWTEPAPWRLTFETEAASVVCTPLETAVIAFADGRTEAAAPDEHDRRFKPGLFGQARTFLDVVRDRAPIPWPACSLDESRAAMELAEALTRACQAAA